MSTKIGKDCAVKLGTDQVLGIGTWSMDGVSSDLLDDTEFGDDWKTYQMGLKDGGQITFNGIYDPDDSTGQDLLRTYNANGTEVTDLRLYVDSASYWAPKTASPTSHVLVTAWNVATDKAGLATASFTAKISGEMELN